MANPNNIDDIFDVTADVDESSSNATSFVDPLLVATFVVNPSFPGRVKTYTGNASDIKAALVNDGFATTSPTYQMVSRVVDQKGATRKVFVGRRDPGDADLVAALVAILAAEDGWYHAYPDPDATTNGEHNAASAWMESQFGMYHIQTDSSAIYNNTPGNLAATVLAAQRKRTVIVWHEPETASGYGPAVLNSSLGSFNLPNGSTVQLRVDGGATQVFTFTSAQATVTGSVVEPYAVTDGDDIVLALDNGDDQTLTVALTQATNVSVNAEPYAMTNAMNLLVRRNGAAATNVVFNGTAGDVATTTGAPFALVNLETVTFAADGGGNQVVTFNAVDFAAIGAATSAELAAVYTAQLTGFVITNDGLDVTVTSARLGTSSDAEIVAGTGGALAALGYIVGNNAGTGFAAFLDAATAIEVAAEIDVDTANVIAVADGTQVSVASDTEGTSSRIQITGGSANVVLGFDTNEYTGTGPFADGSSVSAAQIATWINNNSFGLTSTAPATAVVLTSDTFGNASEIERVSGTLLAVFGFTAASTFGSGFAANSATAEPSEVSSLISLTLTDAAASSASNRVSITSTSQGATASVEAVGGSALSVLFGSSDFASGTGVQQDYVGAAVIGFGSSIKLDRPNGNAPWDNAGNLVGCYGMPPLDDNREVLQETLRCNTYEQRQINRAEFHDGVICRNVAGLHRYIDQQISADYLDARVTEALKKWSDDTSDARSKIPMSDLGLQQGGAVILSAALQASINGHTFYDDSAIDPLVDNSTGITIPLFAELTDEEIDLRRPTGYLLVQRLQNAVQGAIVSIKLVNVLPG